jgi:Mrp family chromosome partitioning ATPase
LFEKIPFFYFGKGKKLTILRKYGDFHASSAQTGSATATVEVAAAAAAAVAAAATLIVEAKSNGSAIHKAVATMVLSLLAMVSDAKGSSVSWTS